MPRKAIPLPEWVPQACEMMVKYDLSLRQAAAELGQDITIEEAEAIKDRKLFKESLEQARLAYYEKLGSSPLLNKETITGAMFKLASRLEQEEPFKSADVLLKLAKVKGLVGYEPDTLWKTLSVLSQKDLDEVRQRLREEQHQSPSADKPQEPGTESVKLVN